MIYWTTLIVTQTVWHRMAACLANNDLDIFWEGAMVSYFKIISQNLLWNTEENHQKLNQENLFPFTRFETETFRIEARSATAWGNLLGF
jgi:hypothetical protein